MSYLKCHTQSLTYENKDLRRMQYYIMIFLSLRNNLAHNHCSMNSKVHATDTSSLHGMLSHRRAEEHLQKTGQITSLVLKTKIALQHISYPTLEAIRLSKLAHSLAKIRQPVGPNWNVGNGRSVGVRCSLQSEIFL